LTWLDVSWSFRDVGDTADVGGDEDDDDDTCSTWVSTSVSSYLSILARLADGGGGCSTLLPARAMLAATEAVGTEEDVEDVDVEAEAGLMVAPTLDTADALAAEDTASLDEGMDVCGTVVRVELDDTVVPDLIDASL
jgi:hypothetical protein